VRLGYHLKRYQDLMAALIMGGEMSVRESWSREQLLLFQEQRLQFLVHFARQRSPFYREAYSSFPDARPVRLAELPVITKKTVIENFDRFVTDPVSSCTTFMSTSNGISRMTTTWGIMSS